MSIDTYLSYLRDVRRMSPNTIESYARDLAGLAAFAEKIGRAVGALDRRDLEAFVRSLMTSGLVATIDRARGRLRPGVLQVRGRGAAEESSPADDLRAPRAWAALPKFLDLEEVDRLLAQPDTATPRGLRDKALISVLYATGLRVSELISLKLGQPASRRGLPHLHRQGRQRAHRPDRPGGDRLGAEIHGRSAAAC